MSIKIKLCRQRLMAVFMIQLLMVFLLATTLPTVAVADSGGKTLHVDGDSDGDEGYVTIQAAVNNSTDGDRIEVRRGTYREEVVITNNITLIAPNGATLNGSSLSTEGSEDGIIIPEGSPVEPLISGFKITGYSSAIEAVKTTGSWTIRDVVITDVIDGVTARETTGDWNIEKVRIQDTRGVGVRGSVSSGDWTVSNTTIRDTRDGAVHTVQSTGNWTVQDSLLLNSTKAAVSATSTDGDWTVEDTVIDSTSFGVFAEKSTGDWQLINVRIVNTTLGPRITTPFEGTGVVAIDTTGAWTIHGSVITGSIDSDVNATDAAIEGNATRNWWGQAAGPTEGQCVGNVTCANPLTEHPGPLALDTGLSEPTDIDDDGLYEDVNGDERFNIIDVAELLVRFDQLIEGTERFFDFDKNGDVNIVDVATLLDEL